MLRVLLLSVRDGAILETTLEVCSSGFIKVVFQNHSNSKKLSGGDQDWSLTSAKSAINLLIDGAAID